MYSFKCLLRVSGISSKCKYINKNEINRCLSSIKDKKRLHFEKESLKNDEITLEELESKRALNSWSDEFGTLTNLKESKILDDKVYEEDLNGEDETEKPYIRLAAEGRKHIPDWYGRKMEKLGKKGMVYEAIELLEKQMIGEDRVRPNVYVFNTLIGILGRAGYSSKAFKCFNMMKKYGMQPTTVTYTSLFNSCANCPDKQEGLERAVKLKELIAEKDEQINMVTYHAAIKAFARCGDLQGAFQVVDEALSQGHHLNPDTFHFLLMASVQDRSSGFVLALQLCALMKKMKMRLNTFHFNLLLRTVRDCGAGSEHQLQELQLHSLLASPPTGAFELSSRNASNQGLIEVQNSSINEHRHYPYVNSIRNILLPHYHNKKKHTDSIATNASFPEDSTTTSITEHFSSVPAASTDMRYSTAYPPVHPRSSHHRLALIGGFEGVIECMQAHKASPDIKTFSLLLDCLPPSVSEEEWMLERMVGEFKVQLDATFCNLLIRRRNLRGDFKAAKDVISLMSEKEIQLDMKTYGCLAMGCSTLPRALSLLQDMQKLGMLPNAEILDIFMGQSTQNFRYKRALLNFIREKKLRLYERSVVRLEKDVQLMRKRLLHQEKQTDDSKATSSSTSSWVNSDQRRDFEAFTVVYKQWLRQIPLEPSINSYDLFLQPTLKKSTV